MSPDPGRLSEPACGSEIRAPLPADIPDLEATTSPEAALELAQVVQEHNGNIRSASKRCMRRTGRRSKLSTLSIAKLKRQVKTVRAETRTLRLNKQQLQLDTGELARRLSASRARLDSLSCMRSRLREAMESFMAEIKGVSARSGSLVD